MRPSLDFIKYKIDISEGSDTPSKRYVFTIVRSSGWKSLSPVWNPFSVHLNSLSYPFLVSLFMISLNVFISSFCGIKWFYFYCQFLYHCMQQHARVAKLPRGFGMNLQKTS